MGGNCFLRKHATNHVFSPHSIPMHNIRILLSTIFHHLFHRNLLHLFNGHCSLLKSHLSCLRHQFADDFSSMQLRLFHRCVSKASKIRQKYPARVFCPFFNASPSKLTNFHIWQHHFILFARFFGDCLCLCRNCQNQRRLAPRRTNTALDRQKIQVLFFSFVFFSFLMQIGGSRFLPFPPLAALFLAFI